MEKRLQEINARKMEIRSALQAGGEVDLEAIQKELETLEKEERSIQDKLEIAAKINIDEVRGTPVPFRIPEKPEEQKHGTDSMEYRKAFMSYVLAGKEIPMELRDNTLTTDVGAVIPETILNKIIEKIEATGMILSRITRTAYKGGVGIPTSNVKPVATWVGEGATSPKQRKGTGSITFGYYKLRCAVSVSLETDTMALSAFEAALQANVAEAMVKALEQSIISGAGTASPKGILSETVVTGQAIDATPVYAKFVEAEAALPLEYENGAVWVMTKKTFGQLLAQVGTDGHPIARVNMGIDGKPSRTLLGREVVLCNYIPTYAAGLTDETVWAFLFDFSDYVLNTNYNMTVKRYEDNETDDQVTKAIILADGKVVDVNSLVTLKK